MNQISIYIVDDHKLMRTLFKSMLKSEEEFVIIGEAAMGDDDAIEEINVLNPDILLIDQNLIGKSGLEVIEAIQNETYNTKSILMSMDKMIAYKNECEKLAVNGTMSKSNSKENIIKIIKKVASGKNHYDK